MISKIDFNIDELASMKKYPDELFTWGNLELLKKRKNCTHWNTPSEFLYKRVYI